MAPYALFAVFALTLAPGVGQTSTPQLAAAADVPVSVRYRALADEFEAARAALGQAGDVDRASQAQRDLRVAFVVRMRPLVELGFAPAIAWTIAHFESTPQDVRDPATILSELYARILPSEAGAEWLWDDEIELLDALGRDALLIGRSTCSSYANAVFNAQPQADSERAIRALTLEADALAPLGTPDPDARRAASAVWQREIARQPTPKLLELCERGLWRLRHVVIGEELPALRGLDVNENEIFIDDFRGKVVVLGIFSMARTGDRKRATNFSRLHDRYEQAPFTVVGVNQDQSPTLFRKLAEELDLRFPCAFEGGRHGRIASALHLDAPPKNLVIDRAGKLRYVDLDPAALEAAVVELVAEPMAMGVEPSNLSSRRR